LRLVVLACSTATICVIAVGTVTWTRHATISARVFGSMWSQWRAQIVLPWFFAFILLLWILQWRYPARRDERMIHPGVAQDLAWFLFSPVLAVTIIAGYLVALSAGVTAVLGNWNLNLVPGLGVWRVAVLALVIADFFGWLSHWMHHRIATLWQFHAVHHSQDRMNVLSDNRQHVVETMVSATIAFLPAWLLGLNTALASTLAISTIYVSAFIHTNIRTNLGPLRYIFISPQAHRVHHSIEPQHYDKNFGTLFSWWDYLFGTHYAGDNEYPPTGVYDPEFPMERSANPARVVTTWTAQTLYPFRVLIARS
jgi:sterol desaturase/sphingolipid hydroxylase (fatty acid hydroxylase superfamily)